jgi:hypothetical protein
MAPYPSERQVVPNGLASLAGATARLFEAKEEATSLSIFANAGAGRPPAFLTIIRRSERISLKVMFTHHHTEEFQSRVLGFFSARRTHLRRETGIVTKYHSRNLWYLIPGGRENAANLATDLLRICFGVQNTDILKFFFVWGGKP